MTLKSLFLTCVGLLLLSSCNSNTDSTDSSDYKVKDSDNTFFWKIEGNGLEQPSFLFGTIHMIPEEHYHLGASVEKAISNADLLITEVKMSDLSSLAFSSDLNYDGNWIDSLSESDQRIILDALHDALGLNDNMSKTMFGTKKPFLAYSSMMLKELSADSKSYEREINQLANEADIENLGLEDAGFQLTLFDAIPMDSVIAWMIESILEEEEASDELEEMFLSYKNEDMVGMVKLMHESSPELMAYEDVFLTDRNKSWIPIIVEKSKTNSCFIAVGAGHLPGENGVIELLRNEGYTLTPLEID